MLWLRALYLHRCVLLLARFKTLVSPRRRGLSLRARVRCPKTMILVQVTSDVILWEGVTPIGACNYGDCDCLRKGVTPRTCNYDDCDFLKGRCDAH